MREYSCCKGNVWTPSAKTFPPSYTPGHTLTSATSQYSSSWASAQRRHTLWSTSLRITIPHTNLYIIPFLVFILTLPLYSLTLFLTHCIFHSQCLSHYLTQTLPHLHCLTLYVTHTALLTMPLTQPHSYCLVLTLPRSHYLSYPASHTPFNSLIPTFSFQAGTVFSLLSHTDLISHYHHPVLLLTIPLYRL